MYDQLYQAQLAFAPEVMELIKTAPMQRLRGISQGVLPQECMTYRLPSRYEHCLGVAHLAQIIVEHAGQLPVHEGELLVLSALLHDAGNPCFSHLGEYFLKRLTGRDGESNLAAVLDRSEMGHILRRNRYTADRVVRFVTGQHEPYSIALHGSMDADNLDNVLRYAFVAKGEQLYNATRIAQAFRFSAVDRAWYLEDDAEWSVFAEVQRWQQARRQVYGLIYQEPHLAAAAMVYHAVDIAFERGKLDEHFFGLTDQQALDVLQRVDPDSAYIVRRARAHQFYRRVFAVESTAPVGTLKEICGSAYATEVARARRDLEDYVRTKTGIPHHVFCVYAGQGKDVRKVELPFVAPDGTIRRDDSSPSPPYRVHAYLDQDHRRYEGAICGALADLFAEDLAAERRP